MNPYFRFFAKKISWLTLFGFKELFWWQYCLQYWVLKVYLDATLVAKILACYPREVWKTASSDFHHFRGLSWMFGTGSCLYIISSCLAFSSIETVVCGVPTTVSPKCWLNFPLFGNGFSVSADLFDWSSDVPTSFISSYTISETSLFSLLYWLDGCLTWSQHLPCKFVGAREYALFSKWLEHNGSSILFSLLVENKW